MTTALQKIARRIKHQGIRKTFFYLLGICVGKCGIQIDRVYRLPEQFCQHQLEDEIQSKYSFLTFSICSRMEDFSDEDIQALREYEEGLVSPNGFSKYFQKGMCCAIARIDEKLAGICWYAKSAHPLLKDARSKCLLIQMCNTFPEFRGRGIYPGILTYACWSIRQQNVDCPILIEVSIFNGCSTRIPFFYHRKSLICLDLRRHFCFLLVSTRANLSDLPLQLSSKKTP